MAEILVPDLEEPVIERLKQLAHGRRMTLETMAASILREAAARRPVDGLVQRADAVAALTPAGRRQSNSADLIREDRDR